MTPPVFFIFAFTVLPLVFMICMAFTNYSKIGNHLMLFDWVGLENFKALFDSSSILGSTFWVCAWMDTDLGVFCNVFQLYLRYDYFSSDQQKGDQGQRLLEILFRTLLRGAKVCIPSDHEDHASAGGSHQRAPEKSGPDRFGCESSVLHGSHLGKSDGHHRKCVGWACRTRCFSSPECSRIFRRNSMRRREWTEPMRSRSSSRSHCRICCT